VILRSPLVGLGLLALPGCMTMDPFLFNPTAVEAYTFGGEVIPASQVEETTFQAGDGVRLHGVWCWAEDPAAPVLIFFHGNTGNLDYYWDRLEFYWSQGYTVFSFDYRGFGRSEGTPGEAILRADGPAAVAHVEETLGQPFGALPLLGLSLGGAVAAHTSVGTPPRVLITEDTFANTEFLTDDGASGLDMPSGWFFEDPWDNAAALSRQSAPVLIVHAADDTFIPSTAADILYAAARDPKALWKVPGADHAEIHEVAPAAYAARVAEWINAHPTAR
jgi:fermentation-respiration switch protein FrsA (DUF1100 family)